MFQQKNLRSHGPPPVLSMVQLSRTREQSGSISTKIRSGGGVCRSAAGCAEVACRVTRVCRLPYLTQGDRKTCRPERRPGEAAGKHVVAQTHARAHPPRPYIDHPMIQSLYSTCIANSTSTTLSASASHIHEGAPGVMLRFKAHACAEMRISLHTSEDSSRTNLSPEDAVTGWPRRARGDFVLQC
jgi:hypothetical protein